LLHFPPLPFLSWVPVSGLKDIGSRCWYSFLSLLRVHTPLFSFLLVSPFGIRFCFPFSECTFFLITPLFGFIGFCVSRLCGIRSLLRHLDRGPFRQKRGLFILPPTLVRASRLYWAWQTHLDSLICRGPPLLDPAGFIPILLEAPGRVVNIPSLLS